MKNSPHTRTHRRGFTLVEAMVSMAIMSLIFLGTITLFTEAQRLTQRSSVGVQASQDATVGLQSILGSAREAYQFALPPDTGANGFLAFTPPVGSVADYQVNSMNTGIEFQAPGAASITLKDRSGTAVTLAGTYDRTLGGDLLWYYRGDPSGDPNPRTGRFLWMRRRKAGAVGTTFDETRAICKLILTKHADGTDATDAVQFIRPVHSGITEQWQVEVKLVSGAQTSINGTQTNEATDGSSVNRLYGKCAEMRNHK